MFIFFNNKRVFEIFELGFLSIGHTHENIEGTYGRLLAKPMRKDIFSLSNIMDMYRACEDQNFYVPYLINEFYDFKNFVKPHLLDGNAKIIDINKMPNFYIYA